MHFNIMQYRASLSSLAKPFLASCLGLSSLFLAPSALANAADTDGPWTQVTRWLEGSRTATTDGVLYPQEYYTTWTKEKKSYHIRPHQEVAALFPDAIVGDGLNKATSDNLWVALMSSPHVIGNSSNLTRARDVMEDFEINFVVPGVNDRNYWFNYYEDHSADFVWRHSHPLTLLNGPQHGQSLMGNNNLLAMGNDNSMWLDADGSLSFYRYYTGTVDVDPKQTTFSGGASGWAGASLRSKLNTLIGYEQGYLYFLEGDSTLHVYGAHTLGHIRTGKFVFDGDLAGRTLGEVVDGRVDGALYLGWDAGPVVAFAGVTPAIPEPSTYALMGLGLVALGWVRRRRPSRQA